MSFGTGGGFTGFGAASAAGATSTPSLSFGATNTFGSTAPAPTAFGATTGFGGAATTSTASAFGAGGGAFGATTGFGAAKPAFGAPGATSTAPAFGGFGAATTSTLGGGGLFGQTSKPSTLSFGGATTQPAFGTTLGQPTMGAFGQPAQQQQQQQPQVNPTEQLYNAVLHCSVFGDERDSLLARWNMLQASWGVGKAFFSQTLPPVDLTPENALCRFKTIGYSAIPSAKNEDGLLTCLCKKKAAELLPQKAAIAGGIQGVMGNKPNVQVVVDEIKASGAQTSEVVFHVVESNQQTGQTRKVPASEIHGFLSQAMQAQGMQKMGLESLSPKLPFTKSQIKAYLDSPPQQIDPRLWKQAQLDNPDPKSLIPVPLIGFKALQQRIQCQDQQAATYKARLGAIEDGIGDLRKRHQDTLAKLRDAKRRQLDLSHRVLHVMVKQEETRKIGFTIQPEEEKLRIQLEALQAEMSAPTQFKGRLNELLSQVRLQSQVTTMSGGGGEKYTMDAYLQHDIKNVLKQQQQGIQALVALIKQDMADLEVVTEQEEAKKSKQF